MIKYRVAASVIVLLSIIFLPYWAYLPLLFAAMIVFPVYWEAIVLALFIDVLYGRGIVSVMELLSPGALIATILLIALLPVRERLRVHV